MGLCTMALLATALSHAGDSTCSSAAECSLNGACVSGRCVCDAAWAGPRCSRLNLVPMDRDAAERGVYRPTDGATSWGASVVHSKEDGLYHMFAAQMKGNCTLTSWIPNSEVIHATAAGLLGPYTFREVLFETFHHNPRLVRDPHDGAYLLFMIGGPHPGTADCSGIPPAAGEMLDTRIVVSRATSVWGPWSEPTGSLLARGGSSEWDYVVTNPAPIILPNGTTLLYYRGTPKYWNASGSSADDLPESVGLAVADHWTGPYVKRFATPILSVMNEDPFAWYQDDAAGGSFHMLTHGRDDWWNTHHSFSRDGLTWSTGADVAADPNITLTDGGVYKFTNRERPWIYFNETTGRPAVLFTGVCPGVKYTYAYTLAQRIEQRRAV
eukprot:TRINITY_DN10547_c0_g1_i1.p1 TRINITY_DN10547_c0_g1~~TRINITY_DN10547_c0_g1_i1.p1  ORF type:complete len:382 (+),score=71.61 TRINITY_DN10547_c0_g1_i1:103-1248(+)